MGKKANGPYQQRPQMNQNRQYTDFQATENFELELQDYEHQMRKQVKLKFLADDNTNVSKEKNKKKLKLNSLKKSSSPVKKPKGSKAGSTTINTSEFLKSDSENISHGYFKSPKAMNFDMEMANGKKQNLYGYMNGSHNNYSEKSVKSTNVRKNMRDEYSNFGHPPALKDPKKANKNPYYVRKKLETRSQIIYNNEVSNNRASPGVEDDNLYNKFKNHQDRYKKKLGGPNIINTMKSTNKNGQGPHPNKVAVSHH